MIIPEPKFKRVRYNVQGLSFIESFIHYWRNPPRIELVEDYIIILDDGLELIHPKGFVIDGASVPRPLWTVPGFSPFGPLLEGAIPHDLGYQHGFLLTRKIEGATYPILSREFHARHAEKFRDLMPLYLDRPQNFFDKLIREITIEVHGARKTANIAYGGLRLCGGNAWNNYRANGPGAYNSNSLDLPGRDRR